MENLENILNDVIKVVRQAGQAVLSLYNGNEIEITEKNVAGETSPVTQADIQSNQIILKGLAKYGYGILSEETADTSDRLSKNRVWIVDPLDGTSDFIKKTGDFTIMVALVESGRPILGVIYQPLSDNLYYAIQSTGAYLKSGDSETRKLSVSSKDNLSDFVMLGSRFHKSELEAKFAQSANIGKYEFRGSSLKICEVASGAGDLAFNPSDKTWEWDLCAADIILSEAGGRLTDLDGKDFVYNKKNPRNLRGYIGSNGKIHLEVLDNLKLLRNV